VLALPLYVAVVVWLTWPLAAHVDTALPHTWEGCHFDLLQMVWALAHQSRALVTAPWAIAEANIYHPTPHALFYGDAGSGALPFFMPTFLLTGNPALASNLLFLGSVALAAWALHAVVTRWTGSHLAGFVAAWSFLTSRWVLWTWIPSAPHYAVLVYFPFVMLLGAMPTTGRGPALLFLSLLVLQGLATIYVAVPMLLGVGIIATVRALGPRSRRAGFRLIAVVLVAGLFLLAADAGYLVVRAENPSLATQTPWNTSADAVELPWGPLRADMPMGVPVVTLLLVTAGAVSVAWGRAGNRIPRAPWVHGAYWVIVGLGLSLTPTVRWFGTPISLGPFVLSSWLPGLRRFDRMGVVGLMGLSVLAGIAFAECARRPGHRRLPSWATVALAGAVAAAMYAQYARGVAMPGPLRVASLPSSYPIEPAIAPTSPLLDVLRKPGGPLVEVPATWGRLHHPVPAFNASAMYRSIFHGRPLLNGYDGYWPAEFPGRMALAATLPDPGALARLRRETGLELILAHVGQFGLVEREVCEGLEQAYGPLPPPGCHQDFGGAERAAWLGIAEQGGRDDLHLLARDGDDLLFAVTSSPAG